MISKATTRTTPKHVRGCARRLLEACSACNVHGAVRGVRAAVHRRFGLRPISSQRIVRAAFVANSTPTPSNVRNLANRAFCEVTILANLAEKNEASQPLTTFCEVSEVISPLRTHAGACTRTRAGENERANRTGLKITSHNLANLAEPVVPHAAPCHPKAAISNATLAHVGDVPRRGHNDPYSRPNAPRRHPLAHGASAKVAEPKTTCRPANRYFPANSGRRRQREPTQA
jgi:hypothetical protein